MRRGTGEVSKLYATTGVITLVSFISPYRADRDAVRNKMETGDFIEVYMKIPLSVCEDRDPKGLYKAARAGKIKGATFPVRWLRLPAAFARERCVLLRNSRTTTMHVRAHLTLYG
jgi:hypothetical protein